MQSYFWFLLLLTVTAATSECPQNCICSPIRNQQTPNHDHAICTTLNHINGSYLNIHSLDLSSINMDSIPIELNSLQNVTHLDLSKNQLTKLTKLNNRIRSLDLSRNRLTSSEIVKISPKIRILNLSYNQITRLPLDVMHFRSLKSINLIGNRIDCSCETLTVRDWLYQNSVWIGKHTICASPLEVRHQPWDKVSINKMCSIAEQINDENKIELHSRSSREVELSDFVAEEFLPFDSHSILKRQVPNDENLGDIVEGSGSDDVPEDVNDMLDVGSGEGSGTDPDINIESIENVSPEDYDDIPEEDGSGSGYGLTDASGHIGILEEEEEEDYSTTEEPLDKKPIALDIFEGSKEGFDTTIGPSEVIEPIIQQIHRDPAERLSENAVKPAGNSLIEPSVASDSSAGETKKEEGKSTYVLLAILGILLVCLIGYVIVKRRKNRRRPYDHRDAENVREIEMLDMKKNSNGQHPNVEIVPLMPKKEQPKIERGMGDAPVKEINSNIQPLHATTYPKVDAVPLKQNDVPPTTTDALPENNNNFTEVEPSPTQDIPKPVDEIDDNANNKPTQNGHNGQPSDDEVFLPEEVTVKRYSPVYSPETGRVKIKLTETPKPKTPIVVTRSRSNAGAYITTPNLNIRATSANGQ